MGFKLMKAYKRKYALEQNSSDLKPKGRVLAKIKKAERQRAKKEIKATLREDNAI